MIVVFGTFVGHMMICLLGWTLGVFYCGLSKLLLVRHLRYLHRPWILTLSFCSASRDVHLTLHPSREEARPEPMTVASDISSYHQGSSTVHLEEQTATESPTDAVAAIPSPAPSPSGSASSEKPYLPLQQASVSLS